MLELANARRSVVVATHSNARKLANHPRNLTDAQIRAVAATGGVVGVAFHAPFLSDTRNARLADVVRHILHIRRIAGIAAVAIGSDFEGGIRPPPELRDVRGFPRLAAALREAGLSQREIEQVFGRNAQRVLCQTAVQR
jgi:membrane dipeptidase